jgi:hypothetical protein
MALALWWGSLSAIAGFVVPMLFANLPTPAMAGNLAGRLFGAQTWVSLACGGLVLCWLCGQMRTIPASDGHFLLSVW